MKLYAWQNVLMTHEHRQFVFKSVFMTVYTHDSQYSWQFVFTSLCSRQFVLMTVYTHDSQKSWQFVFTSLCSWVYNHESAFLAVCMHESVFMTVYSHDSQYSWQFVFTSLHPLQSRFMTLHSWQSCHHYNLQSDVFMQYKRQSVVQKSEKSDWLELYSLLHRYWLSAADCGVGVSRWLGLTLTVSVLQSPICHAHVRIIHEPGSK